MGFTGCACASRLTPLICSALTSSCTSSWLFRPPTLPKQHEVIYYHGTELPQVQDFGGAQMGKSGRAGGDEAFHKTQTLKVARGNPTSEKVVDAPNLKLPVSAFPVANLLAL